jgi:hypothetical protein
VHVIGRADCSGSPEPLEALEIEAMTIIIDTPGLAKLSSGDLLRQLINERARVQRRLDKTLTKVAGLKALKDDLRPYLQSEDHEHILGRLEREKERWHRRYEDLGKRISDEKHRQFLESMRQGQSAGNRPV